MAKKKKNNGYDRAAVLNAARDSLADELGYPDVGPAKVTDQDCIVAMVSERPVVLAWAPEQAGPISPVDQEYAQELAASIPNGPADYVWATSTGQPGDGYIFSWLPEKECQVSELPSAQAAPEGQKGRRTRADAAGFKQLQSDFDLLHEQIYAAREPVDSSNDLTAQLCKCIFLKMHLERDPDFRAKSDAPLLIEIFDPEYITKHGDKAVNEIKAAFTAARGLAEYNVVDDRGNSFEIFDQDDFIKFRRPDTYAAIARFLTRHRLTQPETSGIEDDMVGRAFDVMLRGKFEGKGGMGVYLTPQEVREAMVQMVFHDLLTDDSGLLTRIDPKTGEPELRVCDPCCGSGGFLITSMRETRKHVEKLVGMSQQQRAKLLQEVFHHGFEGADNASNMVLLARINMALHGDTHPRVFRVSSSLTTDIFEPESFDLILTNPPFKKGGISAKAQEEVLRAYQSGNRRQGTAPGRFSRPSAWGQTGCQRQVEAGEERRSSGAVH
jgi:type I restriction enzyme M protein